MQGWIAHRTLLQQRCSLPSSERVISRLAAYLHSKAYATTVQGLVRARTDPKSRKTGLALRKRHADARARGSGGGDSRQQQRLGRFGSCEVSGTAFSWCDGKIRASPFRSSHEPALSGVLAHLSSVSEVVSLGSVRFVAPQSTHDCPRQNLRPRVKQAPQQTLALRMRGIGFLFAPEVAIVYTASCIRRDIRGKVGADGVIRRDFSRRRMTIFR